MAPPTVAPITAFEDLWVEITFWVMVGATEGDALSGEVVVVVGEDVGCCPTPEK